LSKKFVAWSGQLGPLLSEWHNRARMGCNIR